jgi:hypothetical protein
MRPPNYQQARKNKEQRRKLRQQEKLLKRSARTRSGEASQAEADATASPPKNANG